MGLFPWPALDRAIFPGVDFDHRSRITVGAMPGVPNDWKKNYLAEESKDSNEQGKNLNFDRGLWTDASRVERKAASEGVKF